MLIFLKVTILPSLFQMLTKYNQDSSVKNMVDKMDWVIMPSLNPDGYKYTWSGVSSQILLGSLSFVNTEVRFSRADWIKKLCISACVVIFKTYDKTLLPYTSAMMQSGAKISHTNFRVMSVLTKMSLA